MPYTPTTWVFNTTMGTFTRMNNLETQYTEATNSFEQDLFTPFVFSGAVPTKDGSVANQLDIPAYVAFLLQTDNTLRRRATTSTTKVTATPSTTYFLDLNPDGTWSWATTHSGVTGHLTICSVTTDGSGNISVVTDARTKTTTLLNGMLGPLQLKPAAYDALEVFAVDTTYAAALGIGDAAYSQGAGLYAFDVKNNGFIFKNGTSSGITFTGTVTTGGSLVFGAPVGGTFSQMFWFPSGNFVQVESPQSGATPLGITFATWTGSAGAIPFSIGGRFNSASSWVDASGNYNGQALCSLPTTRNGTATSARIYTGTGTPSSPRAGDIWLNQ